MAELALNNGNALFSKDDFTATWPIVEEDDVEAVREVAASGNWWRSAQGTKVEEFEQQFAEYHDAGHCLAMSNGTVAIEAALHALEVEPGEEVIVPSMTFIASASAVLMANAIPVFADIDPETYQLDPASVEARVTDRTKGIVTVHYTGYPSDLDALKDVADRHNLFLLEDAAHAQSTEWRGRKVGAIGDIGTFSFQQSKALTAGEGGAIVTDNADLYERAYAYHHIGRGLKAAKYDHTIVGPNYRLTEFQGVALSTQLKKLQGQTEARMKNADEFFRKIADIPGLVALKPDERITQRGHYFIPIRYLQDAMEGVHRDTFLQALQKEGVPVAKGYGNPVHKMPAFAEGSFGKKGCPVTCGFYDKEVDYANVHLPNAEHACANEQLTIPHHYFVYEENVEHFSKGFHKVYENLKELR